MNCFTNPRSLTIAFNLGGNNICIKRLLLGSFTVSCDHKNAHQDASTETFSTKIDKWMQKWVAEEHLCPKIPSLLPCHNLLLQRAPTSMGPVMIQFPLLLSCLCIIWRQACSPCTKPTHLAPPQLLYPLSLWQNPFGAGPRSMMRAS